MAERRTRRGRESTEHRNTPETPVAEWDKLSEAVLGNPLNRAKHEEAMKKAEEREGRRKADEQRARKRPDWVIEALKLTLISLSTKSDPKNPRSRRMLATGEGAWTLFAEIVALGARGKELYSLIPRAAEADDLHGLLERVGVVTMRGLLSWEHAEKNEADQCEAIRQNLADIHSLRSDMDRASAQLERTRQRVRREVLADTPAKQHLLIGGREVYLMDGEEKEWGPDDGSGIDVYVEDGREVRRKWSRDVRVPLRQCDYETPIIARLYPFQTDSPEEAVDMHLAAALTLYVPFWRRFKLWPICEVNGIRGYRAIHAAYAETRRMLLEYGYSEKDFEQAPLVDIVELLGEGDCRRECEAGRAELAVLRRRIEAAGRPSGKLPDGGKTQTEQTGSGLNVKLCDFLRQYCAGGLSKSRASSLAESMQAADRRGKIKLPRHVGRWKKGQAKYYTVDSLRKAWPKYRDPLPSLPDLKPLDTQEH